MVYCPSHPACKAACCRLSVLNYRLLCSAYSAIVFMISVRKTKQQANRLLPKQLFLFLVSCTLLLLFFLLPRNNTWLSARPLKYAKEFVHQKDHLATEYRKQMRWGNDYRFSKQIAGFFERQNHKEKALVLLPPKGYFKNRKVAYNVPEPAVFYYYTGLKTVWINSSNAGEANWLVRAHNGAIIIDAVTDKRILADSIRAFKKYKLSL
jgi:hypothetical protein